MPDKAVIKAEEQEEQAPSHPIIDESAARPGKKNGPQHGAIGAEEQAMRPRGVIRTEDQAMQPRGVVQTEEQTQPRSNAQTAKMLQRKMGNQRAGEIMAQGAGPGLAGKKEKSITTPLPKNAERKPGGEAVVERGGVQVTILPDMESKKNLAEADAETHPLLHWRKPGFKPDDAGHVSQVVGYDPPTVTIQTVYGPGATAKSKSSYGRGTTPADIRAGNTTLGFHEGSHGKDALEYLQNHPLPEFTGKPGMSARDFKKAVADYDAAMQKYQKDLNAYSRKQTDCVGKPDEGC